MKKEYTFSNRKRLLIFIFFFMSIQIIKAQTVTFTPSYNPSAPSLYVNVVVACNGHAALPVAPWLPTLTFQINWGDGTSEAATITGLALTFHHTYTAKGTYNIEYDVFDVTAVPFHHENGCPKTAQITTDIPYHNSRNKFDVNGDGQITIEDVRILEKVWLWGNLPISVTNNRGAYVDVDNNGKMDKADLQAVVIEFYRQNTLNQPHNKAQAIFDKDKQRDCVDGTVNLILRADGAKDLEPNIKWEYPVNQIKQGKTNTMINLPVGSHLIKLRYIFPDQTSTSLDAIIVEVKKLFLTIDNIYNIEWQLCSGDGFTRVYSAYAQAFYYEPDQIALPDQEPSITYDWFVNGVLIQSGSDYRFTYSFPNEGDYDVCLSSTATGCANSWAVSPQYCQTWGIYTENGYHNNTTTTVITPSTSNNNNTISSGSNNFSSYNSTYSNGETNSYWSPSIMLLNNQKSKQISDINISLLTNSILEFKFQNFSNSKMKVSVIDITGRLLNTLEFKQTNLIHRYNLSGDNIKFGIYFVKVDGGGLNIIKKIYFQEK